MRGGLASLTGGAGISREIKFWAGVGLFACSCLVGLLAREQLPANFPESNSATRHPAPELGSTAASPQSSTTTTNDELLSAIPPLGTIASLAAGQKSSETHSGQPADNHQTLEQWHQRLASARKLRLSRLLEAAQPLLVGLLVDESPEEIQQGALVELAFLAQDQNDLPRAQQVLSQFLNRWPGHLWVPEVLLLQGQLFRKMGLNTLAMAKFYAVMTSALSLKSEKMEYYQRLVIQAQTEIAETHYASGNYAEAADFFARLLKQDSILMDRPHVQYRLIRSLSALNRNAELTGVAEEFLAQSPDSPEQPEVRFYLASALKQIGQNGEALGQVLTLLKEQKEKMKNRPEAWAYWQQRAGNEVANQLYREGDYTRALEIYLNLAKLDNSPAWQVPANYQIGLTFERLMQPVEAGRTYKEILAREPEARTNASPGLIAVFDMARWRLDFINWQTKAEQAGKTMAKSPPPPPGAIDSVHESAPADKP